MGDQIKVDYASLENLSSGITSQANSIEQLVETLRSQIANLEAEWEGAAGGGFQQTKNAWNQAADDLKQTLASIGTAVGQANEAYRATETSNANRWG